VFAYEQSDVHLRYDAARSLPASAARELMEALRRHVRPPVQVVVDLGCGTGRFLAPLSETFDVPVLGIEPAANMMAVAKANSDSATARLVRGEADRIPLADGSADLVFLSQVFHHLEDRGAALAEFRRVLRSQGCLAIRQTTRENLDSYYYQRFFPDARQLDERRLPSRSAVLRLARAAGYRLLTLDALCSEIAPTSADYVAKIALRSYSDLTDISDAAFHRGLSDLEACSRESPDFPRFAENDFFVFAT
jgi:ubiquinone/menaquinone biosynthesis C-methylase UbiE